MINSPILCALPHDYVKTNQFYLKTTHHGLVQDCSISFANALEILQSCTNPSNYGFITSFLFCRKITHRYDWWTPIWRINSIAIIDYPPRLINRLLFQCAHESQLVTDKTEQTFFSPCMWVLLHLHLKYIQHYHWNQSLSIKVSWNIVEVSCML